MVLTNVIFDFDHTLVELGPHVDWRQAIRDIERIYLEEGIPPPVVEQSKGVGFRMMRQVYDYMLGALPQERVLQIQSRAFNALESHELRGAERATPIEGVEGVLSWLRSSDFQCAIVSSNGTGTVERSLACLGLSHFFCRVFGRDASHRLKPYPDQNQACLNALGWQPAETVLVGDSPDDIESAKPLSIFTVGVVSGLAKQDRLIGAGADRIIANFSELPAAIQSAQAANVKAGG